MYRTSTGYQAWQADTYRAIVDSYNAQQSAYEAAVAAMEASQSVEAVARTGDESRQIERNELQKACLMLITDSDLSDYGALSYLADGLPVLDRDATHENAPEIQFLTNCFEWDQLMYIFYPYFWGAQERWADSAYRTDSDLQFQNFLRAGAARVLVPVRLHYEEALHWYLHTGEVWNGGEVPTIDDPLYVSLAEELLDSYDIPLDEAEPYSDDVWEAIVPTTLVRLQETPDLPTWES